MQKPHRRLAPKRRRRQDTDIMRILATPGLFSIAKHQGWHL